ncbi:MAG: hypothetical protein Q8L69_16895 [Gallionellaceae bacterium]|nr:hypothetical protein [Gallionellaceae bacterium]
MTVQFSDFYNSLDADPAKRGKQFEHFVKWFLKADLEWSTQVDQIWLWDEWPQCWGADCGKKQDPYTLEFQEFTFDEKQYPRRSILPFLQSEFDRQSLRVHKLSHSLNSVLKEIKNQPTITP